MDKLLEKILKMISYNDNMYYRNKIANPTIEVIRYETVVGTSMWSTGQDYAWVPIGGDNHDLLLAAGPAMTARLLVNHRENTTMTYLTWYAAVIQSILSRLEYIEDRYRNVDVYKTISDIDIMMLKKYDKEFQYHHACKNVLPVEIPRLFRAAICLVHDEDSFVYTIASIVSNIAFISVSTWNIVNIEYKLL